MTTERQVDTSDTVELTVPADPAYLSVLRTVIASLAAQRDFTLDEIDDLRLAVDEAGALLLPHAADGSRLSAVFGGSADSLRVTVTVTASHAPCAPLDRSSFAWLVLAALTDSVALDESGQPLSLVLSKTRGRREQ